MTASSIKLLYYTFLYVLKTALETTLIITSEKRWCIGVFVNKINHCSKI